MRHGSDTVRQRCEGAKAQRNKGGRAEGQRQQRYDAVPAAGAPGQAAQRADNARTHIVEEQVQRRGQRAGSPGPARDPAAGHRVRREKAKGEECHPGHHDWQRARHRQQQPSKHGRQHDPQYLAPADPVRKPAGPHCAEHADCIQHRQQTDCALAQTEGALAEAVAYIVEQADKHPHEQKAQREQPAQAAVSQVHARAALQSLPVGPDALGGRRWWQQAPERPGRIQASGANDQHRRAPRHVLGEGGGRAAPGQAAERSAADVDPHRQSERGCVDLFAQVGHGDRRHAAQREPDQRAQHQQLRVVLRKGGQQRANAGANQRASHEPFAANQVCHRAAGEQRQRERERRYRQRPAALRRRERELARQFRHQGLHAIEHRKGGKAAIQHGAVDALESGAVGGMHGVILSMNWSFMVGSPCHTVQYIFKPPLIL